jgi:hypothetical protein
MPEKTQKECDNPKCSAKFIPYSSRQRACNKKDCKIWLMEQSYKKTEYRFEKDYCQDLIQELLKFNTLHKKQIAMLENLTFTHDNLEKVKEQ